MTDVSDRVHIDALLGSLARVGQTADAIATAAAKPVGAPPSTPPAPSSQAGGVTP